MKPAHSVVAAAAFTLIAGLAPTAFAAGGQDPSTPNRPRPVRVIVYPILVQAPIFGAEVNLPSIPGQPPGAGGGEGGDLTGSTDVALNAAYMAGIEVITDRVFAEANGTWAALSADRQTPRVNIKSDTLLFNVRGGVRLFAGLYATGGVRRIVTDLDATLTIPSTGAVIEGKAKPGIWDPMVGLDYRVRTPRVDVALVGQYGGFGVGTDADASGEFRLDIRPLKFLDVRLGYQIVYYKLTVANVGIGRFQRDLVSRQTLHGPSIGLGFAF